MNDLYKVLGIPKESTSAQIKEAYRRMAEKFHPDKNVGNEVWAAELFKGVQAAYDVLSDPAKRRKYDLLQMVRPTPMPSAKQTPPDPIQSAVNLLVGLASPYVPPDQLRTVIERKIAEYVPVGKPLSLVDFAEQLGFLKKRRKRA